MPAPPIPATTLVASPTVALVIADIISFIQAILGTNVPVYRGVVNRVPAANPAGGFVILTPIYQERLEYNSDTFSTAPIPPPTTLSVEMSMRIDVQADIYGSASYVGTWAAMLCALWHDDFACSIMQNSQPLYAEDARMIPLSDSEQQYEERWSLTLTAQYNPVITPAQLFATGTTFTMIDVQANQPE